MGLGERRLHEALKPLDSTTDELIHQADCSLIIK